MEKKVCIDCGVEKWVGEYYFANKNRTTRYSRCKKCHNQRRQKWSMTQSSAEYQRLRYQELRNDIIDVLGGACASCGYNENILGLDIDHIDNDGYLERKNRKGTNVTMLKRWYENGCKGLQLLCGTCHNIKSRSK